MRNCHTLIIGRTGTGKTVLAKALIKLAARVVVLDRKWEYDGSHVCYSFEEFADVLLVVRARDFCIVLRASDENDWDRAMELARYVQQSEPHGPLVIVLEEASNYGTANSVAETVRQLYNAGRHERISMLAVVQVDTDFHRTARHGSELIVTMYSHKLSGDMLTMFEPEMTRRLVSLGVEFTHWPVQGRHFLVYPDTADLYARFSDAHNYLNVVEI